MNDDLMKAIATVIDLAAKSGVALSINVNSDVKVQDGHIMTEMDSKLVDYLKTKDKGEIVTLLEFSRHLGMPYKAAVAAMRGSGRSPNSVKDIYYERMDVYEESLNKKVRAYRLSSLGEMKFKAS